MAPLVFVYQDAKGNVSERELTSWKDDGWLLKGVCSQDRGLRTFRRDRILAVHEGASLLKPIEMPAHVAASAALPATKSPHDTLEILFTGFPKRAAPSWRPPRLMQACSYERRSPKLSASSALASMRARPNCVRGRARVWQCLMSPISSGC